MGFKMFTLAEAISKAFRENSDKQSGQHSVIIEEWAPSINPIRTDLEGGGKVSVGTSAVEVTFTGQTSEIIITADIQNSGILYIGKSNVDSSGNNALAFLEAGDSIILNYNDATNGVYVVSDTSSQNFFKGALL